MKIGVDLGGTKIEGIVLDANGNSLWRERCATPQGDYKKTLLVIARLVNSAKEKFALPQDLPVGLGTPGAVTVVNSRQVMKNCNSTVLNGKPFPSDLSAELGCQVYIANDANCFALAEARSGAALELFSEPPKTVFGVILGTGVGGGVVIDGKSLIGAHSIAGEWGHNCLPASACILLSQVEKNRLCYCGRHDCIETYLSGPGLSLSYEKRFAEKLNPKSIIEAMRSGCPQAESIWSSYTDQLAASLSQVVNILDPNLIVLGGGMSQITELYTDIAKKMQKHVFTHDFTAPIVPAKLGDSAGVYGAAWLSS